MPARRGVVERGAQPLEPGLQAPAHGAGRDAELARDLRGGSGRRGSARSPSVRNGSSSATSASRAAQHARTIDRIARARRSATSIRCSRARAPGLAAPVHPPAIEDHRREPRPHRPVVVRWMLERRDRRVLDQIVGSASPWASERARARRPSSSRMASLTPGACRGRSEVLRLPTPPSRAKVPAMSSSLAPAPPPAGSEGSRRARRDGRHRARRGRRGGRGLDRGDARRWIACGCPARAPSCARTARRSACRATTTWATARSATTRSAPAGSSSRARSSSAARSRAARCSRARRGKQVVARGARGGARALPRPALRRQRPQPPRSPRGDARARAAKAGCKKLYVHALLDGRDVRADQRRWNTSIASSGARRDCDAVGSSTRASSPAAAACRSRWIATRPTGAMVERGWHTHVLADARAVPVARRRRSRRCAARSPASIDQDLPAFVVAPRRADAGRRRAS